MAAASLAGTLAEKPASIIGIPMQKSQAVAQWKSKKEEEEQPVKHWKADANDASIAKMVEKEDHWH